MLVEQPDAEKIRSRRVEGCLELIGRPGDNLGVRVEEHDHARVAGGDACVAGNREPTVRAVPKEGDPGRGRQVVDRALGGRVADHDRSSAKPLDRLNGTDQFRAAVPVDDDNVDAHTLRLPARHCDKAVWRDEDVAAVTNDDATYALRPDVVATVLDRGALLLDLESKYFYLLNPSAWAMTQLFETGSSIEHALGRCRAWGAPDADLESARSAIAHMIDERLLEPKAWVLPTDGEAPAAWEPVKVERQAEPLQRVIVSAFDPSIPLAE